MRKIYYWPDCCWCDADELYQMGHKSDDFGSIEVSEGESEKGIDALVRCAVNGWVQVKNPVGMV